MRGYASLIVALIIGAIVIFWHLSEASLFLDEAFTLSVAAAPLPQLLALVASADNAPPLFHLLSHVAIALLHWPGWQYRWLTAPFSLVTIAATWAIARRLFGDGAAAVAGIAVALAPNLVDWDRMYRMYSIFVALSAASWWLLLVAQERESRASRALTWAAYVAAAALLPWFAYLGWGVLVSQAVFACIQLRARWPALLAPALAAVSYLPWLPGLQAQLSRGGTLVLAREVHWASVARNLVTPDLPGAWLGGGVFDAAVSIAVIGVVVAGAWLGRRTMLPFWLAPALLQIVAAALLGKNLVNARYLLYALPPLSICLGALVALEGRARLAAAGAVLALLGANALGTTNLLLDPYYQRSDWYAVAVLLAANGTPDDVVVLDQGYTHYAVEDLNGFRGRPTFAVETQASVDEAGRWLDSHAAQRVWYVENQFYYPDPGRRVLADLVARRPPLGTYAQRRSTQGDSVEVLLFGPARR